MKAAKSLLMAWMSMSVPYTVVDSAPGWGSCASSPLPLRADGGVGGTGLLIAALCLCRSILCSREAGVPGTASERRRGSDGDES